MNDNEEKTGGAGNGEEPENEEKRENEDEVVVPITIGTAAMNAADATKTGDNETTELPHDDGGDGKNKRLRNSVIRMAAALVIAVVLLAVTGFSPLKLIKGPTETEDIQSNDVGDFVKRDVYAILGFYADEKASNGDTISRYAVVPMNGKLASVHFTKRYLESAGNVCDATYDFINGKLSSLDAYVTVEGTVDKLSEGASSLLYDWFGTNKAQLVEMNLIADTDDYSTYLTDYVLRVDTINGHSETLSVVLGVLAGIFVLYAIVEIILMATGFYLPKTPKEEADDEAEEAHASETDAATREGDDTEGKKAEEAEEADKDTDSKNGDEEKTDEPEEKE